MHHGFSFMDKQLHMLRYELMFLSPFSIIGLDREKNTSCAVCEAHNLKFLKCLFSGGTWIQGDCCKRITKAQNTTQDTKVVQGGKERYMGCCSQVKDLCLLRLGQKHIKGKL